MKRNRKIYFLLIIIVIGLGLLSRTRFIPAFIYPYLGDYFYALLYFLIVGFIFTKVDSLKVACISILLCYVVEMSQLCQADWLNDLRSYKIGGLILGYGFLWSDLLSYTLGGVTGYILERIYYQKKKN